MKECSWMAADVVMEGGLCHWQFRWRILVMAAVLRYFAVLHDALPEVEHELGA
jgi:hypothetical protein